MRGALVRSFCSEGDYYSRCSPLGLPNIPSLRQPGNPGTAFPVLRHQSYKSTLKCRLAFGASVRFGKILQRPEGLIVGRS